MSNLSPDKATLNNTWWWRCGNFDIEQIRGLITCIRNEWVLWVSWAAHKYLFGPMTNHNNWSFLTQQTVSCFTLWKYNKCYNKFFFFCDGFSLTPDMCPILHRALAWPWFQHNARYPTRVCDKTSRTTEDEQHSYVCCHLCQCTIVAR